MIQRPAIPIAIRREVLLEARHKCAVCCHPTSLEAAHIVPWCQTNDHQAKNLIAMCANCHRRSHTERWAVAVLYHYKRDPCALKTADTRPVSAEQQAMMDLLFAQEPDTLTLKQRLRLVSMLAAYLDVPLPHVAIESVTKTNSSRVRLRLRTDLSERLWEAWRQEDAKLFEFLDDFTLLRIERVETMETSPIVAEEQNSGYVPAQWLWGGKKSDTLSINATIRDARIGVPSALEKLMTLLYPYLLDVADQLVRRHSAIEIDADTLTHEAVLSLLTSSAWKVLDAEHLYAFLARLLYRHMLDIAHSERNRRRHKNRAMSETPWNVNQSVPASAADFVHLDEALTVLARIHSTTAEVAFLRIFGGLTISQAAHALGISPRSASEHWYRARTWLMQRLKSP